MSENMVTISVFQCEKYDAGFPPENAKKFLEWLQQQVAKIPPEFANSATMELDSSGGYEGSHYATIEISYQRPETEEEIARKREGEAQRAMSTEQHERNMLAELRAKYGDL